MESSVNNSPIKKPNKLLTLAEYQALKRLITQEMT